MGLGCRSRGSVGEMLSVRKGRPGLMKPCGRVQSFHHPSHKSWFIWTEQLHRPTTLIHWPSRNPGDRGGPEKNGVVRLVIPSTSTRFTSTALYNVYASEEGQKIKTFLAFATLSPYANLYISQRGDRHFLSSQYQLLSLAFGAFSFLSPSKMFSFCTRMSRHTKWQIRS